MDPLLLHTTAVTSKIKLEPTNLIFMRDDEGESSYLCFVLAKDVQGEDIEKLDVLILKYNFKFEFKSEDEQLRSVGIINFLDELESNDKNDGIISKKFFGYKVYHKIDNVLELPLLHHTQNELKSMLPEDIIQSYKLNTLPIDELLDSYEAKIFKANQRSLRKY